MSTPDDPPFLPSPTCAELCAARQVAGHSQTTAARLVGVTRHSTWSDWERGLRVMPPICWERYLLVTGQHPTLALVDREPTLADIIGTAATIAHISIVADDLGCVHHAPKSTPPIPG